MKKNLKLPYATLIVTVLTFVNITGLYGQGGVNITAGFGFPETINVGLRYEKGQSQIGVAGGFLPATDERITNVSITFWHHFIGSSGFTERRPWFGRLGVDYISDKMEGSPADKLVFLDLRGGREFNISSNFGISLDAGIAYKLYAEAGDSELGQFIFDLAWALPAGGISIFYKF